MSSEIYRKEEIKIVELFTGCETLPEPLSKQETIKLLNRVKIGDKVARTKLIEHNIRLVLFVVKKFNFDDHINQDLVSVGIIGLIKSIDSFDVDKNIQLTTYAAKCIRNEILSFLRKLEKNNKIESLEKVIAIEKSGRIQKLADIVGDDTDFVNDYSNMQQMEIVRSFVAELPERDREIIMMFFGFYNKRYTQTEIAKKFGYDQSYICKRISKILKKMRLALTEEHTMKSREEISYVRKQKNK